MWDVHFEPVTQLNSILQWDEKSVHVRVHYYHNYFQLMGIVSLAIGIWLYTTWNEFATFSDGGRLYGSVFLLATGVGVVIVGYMGIVAALRESRILATMVRYLAPPTLYAMGYCINTIRAAFLIPKVTAMVGRVSANEEVWHIADTDL